MAAKGTAGPSNVVWRPRRQLPASRVTQKPRAPQAVWCDRTLARSPVHYALCTSEAQFKREMRRLSIPPEDRDAWVLNEHSDATTHKFELLLTRKKIAVVCLRATPTSTSIGIAALLVHEAVHIYQWVKELIGEDKPGAEGEAYAIQEISQNLMQAYADQLA